MGKKAETQVSEKAINFQTCVESVEVGIGCSLEQPNILTISLVKRDEKGVRRKVREHIFMLIDRYCEENGISILKRLFGDLKIQIIFASNTTLDICKKLVKDLKLLATATSVIINDALQPLISEDDAVTTSTKQ